ncbi:rhodanese-like domain-containing protein [Microbispora hainanensis]|uniref:sulfurtransferase n=1 Tax=Microbispora hainanensis TaxID=568844 RepID=UPI0033E77DE7
MTATPVEVKSPVISAEELRRKLAKGRDVVLLEIRRKLDPAQGEQGRLPGAHVVELISQLAGPRHPGSGDNPLPGERQIQESVRRWGVNENSIVVVYTRENPAIAARAWWTLTWAGVPDVRYLDGGVDAWQAAGGELVTQAPPEREGDLTVKTGSLPTLDAGQAAALARSGVLLDARPDAAYTGLNGGGHIPGALSRPSAGNLGADGLLKSDEDLRAEYAALGAGGERAVGVYCGGGVGATLDILALAKLGVTAALYPGSWSAWSSDPARPVATGGQPG